MCTKTSRIGLIPTSLRVILVPSIYVHRLLIPLELLERSRKLSIFAVIFCLVLIDSKELNFGEIMLHFDNARVL